MKLYFSFLLLFSFSTVLVFSDEIASHAEAIADSGDVPEATYDTHRVDAHAPIGVMGDHTHKAGEFMFSYRYMLMEMRPNFVGSNEVTAQSQFNPAGFRIIPDDMQTEMHMLGVMYAPTDDLTLSFMLPVIDKAMQHQVINGTTFRTNTNGIGDLKFGGLLNIFESGNTRAHLNLMMAAPTGSTTETGFVPPVGGVIRLPYPMQLGSGTWDLNPGITLIGQSGNFSLGSQILGTVRLGTNDESYSLGNEIKVNLWGALQLSDLVSTSLRLTGTSWGDIDGRDALIAGPVPTARPDLRGGERVDLFYGLNYLFRGGPLSGHRLAVEAGVPLHQNLDGPQLGMDWMMTVGWQKAY